MAEWVPMGEAARRLNISPNRLSVLVKQRNVPIARVPRDKRLSMVDMELLQEMFSDKPVVKTQK